MGELNNVKKPGGTWFRERYTYPRLLDMFKRDLRRKPVPSLAVAIIQLTNGSRVSEALEAYEKWLRTGSVKLTVRVRKKRSPEEREIIIPSFLRPYRSRLKQKRVPSRWGVLDYLERNYGINTHTLRYTFITWHAKTLSPAYISKMIRHSNLNMLMTYLSKREADRLLEEIVP